MYNICVVTATRAEYGLLRPLLFRLKNNNKVNLQLVVSGTHLSKSFGNTQVEIIADGFSDFFKVQLPIDDDNREGMAKAAGTALQEFAALFSKIVPQMIIVLGDRYEMLGVAAAAHFLGIPIAHICGGDVTEGAIDDAVRHCITKFSQLHFPGCEQSRMRIIQMGEQPETVFNVGEPGVENALNMQLLDRKELSDFVSFEGIMHDYSIVTFHPVTMEDNTETQQVSELIRAIDHFPDMNYVITMANADAGGRAINEIWQKEKKRHSNWLVVSSLGVLRYLSAVKYAKAVIGNSSSGIVEAPSLGVPTVNIGDRQKGRMTAESVISCSHRYDDIINSLNIVFSNDFQEKAKHVYSPFGDGNTSELIEKHILDYLSNNHRTLEKHFYDIDFSI